MELSDRIKAARNSRKITQKQLAARINKSFSTVQKYELGLATPPIDVLNDIARALDVHVGELLDYEFHDTVPPGWTETRSPQEIAAEVEKFKRGYDSIQEQKMLEKFRQLNKAGREIAIDCIDGLVGNPKYQKGKD